MSQTKVPSHALQDASFPQTRWSLILNAQEDDPAALAELCRAYWYPLYCFARRMMPDTEDARDLTQAYFEQLLKKETFKCAREERGRLRTFLVAGLRNFSIAQHRKACAQIRGSGQALIEIDAMEAEQRYRIEPRDELSPEREFDRVWARQLLDTVLRKLESVYAKAGKGAIFNSLQDHLITGESRDYPAISAQLGISPARVRLTAFKLRERYRELLRAAIRETVSSAAEVEDELNHLRGLFGR